MQTHPSHVSVSRWGRGGDGRDGARRGGVGEVKLPVCPPHPTPLPRSVASAVRARSRGGGACRRSRSCAPAGERRRKLPFFRVPLYQPSLSLPSTHLHLPVPHDIALSRQMGPDPIEREEKRQMQSILQSRGKEFRAG